MIVISLLKKGRENVGLCWATFFLARVGFGLAFFGPGRVRAGLFWPGSGSSLPFVARGLFGSPILSYFGPFLTNFSTKRAIFEVWAGLGHPKYVPGWAFQNP